MKHPLRILNLEDNPDDSERIRMHLAKGGIKCNLVCVRSRAAFAEAIEKGEVDLILADYSLPSFDGLSALEMAKKSFLEVPFIFVSGGIGEAFAIETLKRGATDFVLKNRLSLLVPAINRALSEVEGQIARRQAERELEKYRYHLERVVKQLETQQAVLDRQNEKILRTQVDLEISHRKYSDLYDFAPVGYFTVDREGIILEANATGAAMLGVSKRQLVKRPFRSFIADERDGNAFAKYCTDVLGSRQKVECELGLKRKKGPLFYARLESVRYTGSEGEAAMIRSVVSDITERKRAEHDLRESEKRYKLLVESVTDYIYTVQVENGWPNSTYHGPNCFSVTGFTSEEYGADSFLWYKMIHEDDRAVVLEHVGRILSGDLPPAIEHRIFHKDGSMRWVKNTFVPHHSKEGRLTSYDGIITDITALKKAENSLRESENKYRNLYKEFNVLLESLTDVLFLLSSEQRIIWLNKAAASYYGGEPNEFIGQFCYRVRHRRDTPCEGCHAISALKTGEIKDYQRTAQSRIMAMRAFPIRDEAGEMKSTLLVGQDITEKRKLEETAKRTYHLAQLGQLSAGIAHEINNPNNVILSSSQMISDIWEDVGKLLLRYYTENGDFLVGGMPFSKMQDDVPRIISRMMECSQRISDIVTNLKEYVCQDAVQPDEKVDINRIISSAFSMLKRQIENCTDNFGLALAENLPVIRGNGNALCQVIINMIMNSLQALPDRKCGVIVSSGYLENDNCVVIRIRDEGCGMSREVLAKAFKPFFTTKHASGGTGLGLSISHTIVQKHKGAISFKTERGKGTTATIKLPVST